MDGDAAARAGLRAAQRERRDEIAARWQEALIPAGLVPHSGATVSRHLRALTERMSALLLAEPFAPKAARALGTALVRLGYGQPAALGRTLEVLGNALALEPSIADPATLQPRLTALLGELATGFAEESRAAILATQGHLRDAQLTALAETRVALRASEAWLHSVATNAPVILFALDRAGVVTFIAGRGLVAVGRSARELIGRTLLVGLGAAPQVPGYVRRALAGEAFSTPVAVNDVVFETHYAPLRDEAGAIAGVIGVALDITERVRAETELAAARHGLAAGREVERRRLARELHDGPVQQLAGLRYQLAAGRHRLACGRLDPALPSTLERIEGEIAAVVGQLRGLIGELRPVGLDALGLPGALENHVAEIRRDLDEDAPPTIALDLLPAGQRLSAPVALTLFRIVQEALANALRHAAARRVLVRLRRRGGAVALSVGDDGRGFVPPPRLSTLAGEGHYGLIGMAERAAAVGGHLRLRTRPGRGTVVAVRIPVPEQGDGDGDDPGVTGR